MYEALSYHRSEPLPPVQDAAGGEGGEGGRPEAFSADWWEGGLRRLLAFLLERRSVFRVTLQVA